MAGPKNAAAKRLLPDDASTIQSIRLAGSPTWDAVNGLVGSEGNGAAEVLIFELGAGGRYRILASELAGVQTVA